MKNQQIAVLDFGGQYNELIARRVRECGVSSIVLPGDTSPEKIREIAPIGIILTGGPDSIYEAGAQKCEPELLTLGVPVLGICYGMHAMTAALGGAVEAADNGEYGAVKMKVSGGSSPLFRGLETEITVLMSHKDRVVRPADGFVTTALTALCENAAIADTARGLYGVQFHPEVESTPQGTEIIRNFLFEVCGAAGDYNIEDYETRMVNEIREQVGEERVLLGLSGGVDSSVCAALLAKAIPGRLHCIFVDHGLMRKNEGDEVEAAFSGRELNFIRVDASSRFLGKLEGVTDPERKRKIIGEEFIRVFEEEARKLKGIKFLAQGTIYPDIIESGTKNSATIKSHHNVGGLPEDMEFTGLVEPLRGLFKSEVRALGRALGLPSELTERQPFPGPGLAVRCIGAITKERLDILREADAIFRAEVEASGVHADQYFAVLTDSRSVGVTGDFRSYGYTVALRAVKTTDFMTCEYVPLPHELLGKVAVRIVGEASGISRVVYDITGKPPATIEWE